MDISERLNELYEFLRSEGKVHTKKDISEKTGIDQGNISKMLKGNPKYATEGNIARFNEAYGSPFNIEWLMRGEGEMKNVKSHSDVEYIAPYMGENLAKIPYVSAEAAASFIESMYDMEYEVDYYGVMPELGEDLLDGTYTVFQVRGDSMEPTIPNHTKILAKKIEESRWESVSGVIVIVYGKTLAVKRVLKNNLYRGNSLVIKADNPLHGQCNIERSEIRGMWQAIRIVSKKIL